MKNSLQGKPDFDDDELNAIAPTLAQIKKELHAAHAENFFALPEGYFDGLNAEVMRKIESLPGTESVSTENPFQVPQGYFDVLPAVVQQKISERNEKRISVAGRFGELFMRPVPKFALALASVILVIVFSAKYFTRTVKVEYVQQQPESEQLDAAYLQQLDEQTLAEVYAEEAIPSTQTQDAGIENYLLDNDIDLNSITEQL